MRLDRLSYAVTIVATVLAAGSAAGGQEAGRSPAAVAAPAGSLTAPSGGAAAALGPIDGPPAPVAPEVVNRDTRGNATVRATRLDRPLQIDGRIDEEVYEMVRPVADFIQQVPDEGAPTTELSEVWILYDDKNLYVSARCIDTEPDRIVANELRRDSTNIFQGGDSFTVVLDTFYDRRNGFAFQTNPLGALREQAIVDSQQIESWNTIWSVRSTRFANGWSTEMVIPFKSLRYRVGGPQLWGMNFRRSIKRKNEMAGLTAVPASFGPGGLSQLGFAGTLVGLETPAQSMNLELKPYAASALTTDLAATLPFRNDFTKNVGFDFKYGLTRSLIADVTANTDFAQVEEDLQQVNLTRFSLFFPEKRDFFLEGQGIFGFGGRSLGARGEGGGSDDVPVMFFSRQIGLSNGQTVPVILGGRVTGKVGQVDVGALNIQTADKAAAGAVATNFSAVRLKRDILRRSNIGIIATERRPTAGGGDPSLAMGADANFRVSDNLTVVGYYARTATTAAAGQAASYRGLFQYSADRYGLGLEYLSVAARFQPAVGFARRDDFRRSSASARFSPRLKSNPLIRKLTWQSSTDYIIAADTTEVQNRSVDGSFGVEFHSGDMTSVQYVHEYEFLPGDFRIAPEVTVPKGGYDNRTASASYTLAPQRTVAGRLAVSSAQFYGGTKYETTYSGRIAFVPQFSVEPSVSLNWVSLPFGDFTATVVTTRLTVTPTPRLLVSSLVQLNAGAHTLSSSVRLRWEYLPGSELFVVYSDGRDTSGPDADLLNRSFAVKLTRLVRF